MNVFLDAAFARENKWFVDLLAQEHDFVVCLNEMPEKRKYPFSSANEQMEHLMFKIYFLSFNYRNTQQVNSALQQPGDAVVIFDVATAVDLFDQKFDTDNVNRLREQLHCAIRGNSGSLKFLKTLMVSPKASGIRSFSAGDDDDVIKYLFADSRCRNSLCLAAADEGQMHNTNGVVVREWRDDLHIDNELRVFVIDNKIVGISRQSPQQSHFMDYFVRFNKDTIFAHVRDRFVAHIASSTKFTRYCLDVAVLQHEDGASIVLIEVNPFYEWCNTGMCLFEDRQVAFSKDTPSFLID